MDSSFVIHHNKNYDPFYAQSTPIRRATPAAATPPTTTTPANNSSNRNTTINNLLPFGLNSSTKSVRFDSSTQSLPSYTTPSRPTNSHPTAFNPLSSSVGSSQPFQQSQSSFARLASLPTPPRVLASPVSTILKTSTVRPVKGTVPRSAGESRRRLKINGLLSIAWFFLNRNVYYLDITGLLIKYVPSLDVPLHILESTITLLLLFNVIEAIYSLTKRPTKSPVSTAPATLQADSPRRFLASPKSTIGGGSVFTPTVRSSPKTRPSPSHSPSPLSLPRSSSAQQLSPSTNRTPGTPITPLATNRRRSLLSSSIGASGSGREGEDGLGMGKASDKLTAYAVRHSPIASNLHKSISDRNSIDRLLTQI